MYGRSGAFGVGRVRSVLFGQSIAVTRQLGDMLRYNLATTRVYNFVDYATRRLLCCPAELKSANLIRGVGLLDCSCYNRFLSAYVGNYNYVDIAGKVSQVSKARLYFIFRTVSISAVILRLFFCFSIILFHILMKERRITYLRSTYQVLIIGTLVLS